MASPVLNKLFSELLVSKNKLSLLRSYYTGIKDSIVNDLTDLYNSLVADVDWVDRKISDLAVDKSDALTTMSEFVSNTEDSLAVNHEKYQEMMTAYNSCVKTFYSRMTSLYSTYEQDFNENEISSISSEWKFHYTTNYGDAQPVEHTFGPLNFTSESEIFELSNNRFIYMTNENVVYDVDYVNKDVYIVTIDSKTFANQFNQKQGSRKNYFGHERAHFNTLFRLNGKSNIYALINIGNAYTDTDINALSSDEKAFAVVGKSGDSSPIQRLVPCVYDYNNHVFNILTDNTSDFYIRGNTLKDNKITFVDGTVDDFYFYYIGPHFVRVKIDGTKSSDVTQRMMGTSNIDIVAAVLDKEGYFILPISETAVAVYRSSASSIDFSTGYVRAFDFMNLSEKFNSGEEGILQNLFYCTNISGNGTCAIYAVTDKSIWYTTSRFSNVDKDSRTNSISITNLSFTNKDEYLIDEFGYIYVLGDNARLYCAKTTDGISLQGTVVESPTRYADKIMNISSLISSNLAGYLYSIDTELTKAQTSDKGSESYIYTYTEDEYAYTYNDDGSVNQTLFKNSTWFGVTEYGKVVALDIDAEGTSTETKKHLYTRHSICENKQITAFYYDEDTETFFFFTKDRTGYYISKSDLEMNTMSSSYDAKIFSDLNVGSDISAIIKIDDYLYIGCVSGEVDCYTITKTSAGVITGEFHSGNRESSYYVESDKQIYHIDGGNAIGNTKVVQLLTDGSCLIVLGLYGRVASCALNSNVWTGFDGKSTNSGEIDSNIYSDGSALNGRDIVCGVNYSNSKLIVIGKEGYVASCNLVTGNWSKYDGTTENHGQTGVGPGIYNNGTILGGKNPTCTARIGTTLFIGGEQGRMASVNILTGGVTEYRGTTPDVSSTLSGPGYYYTGSDLASLNDITAMTTDTYAGIVILSGVGSFVLSYSPSLNEVMKPSTDKLYYVARRQSNYDYLSSLLVRVTKGTLNEYSPLYPPHESDDIFEMAFESSYYVYQNGDYVWRVSTSFDKVYFSKNGGTTYESMNIGNSGILPEISTNTSRYMPMGEVANDGTFAFVDKIAGESYFIYGTHTEDGFDANWIASPINFEQKDINTFRGFDNGSKYDFRMTYSGKTLKLKFENDSVEVDAVENSTINFISDSGKMYSIIGDNFAEEDSVLFNIKSVIETYLSSVEGFVSPVVSIVDGYYTKGSNFTFVTIVDSNKIALITLNISTMSEGLVEDNYSISCKLFNLNEVKLENAKDLFTDDYDNDVTTFEIVPESEYTITDYDGIRGFVGFDVRITSNVYTSSEYRHVLIAISGSVFGTRYINNSAVYTVADSAARLVCYDRSSSKIQIAQYNTLDDNNIIMHVNAINTYQVIEAQPFTPIRALTDAWKVCELKMTNTDINAFAIRLKLVNTEEDDEYSAIAKQFTLRYQVLISDVTNGRYILYETEKSTGISKTDDETKVVEPLIRVIACDGFEDEIMELYTSRRDSVRRSLFAKKAISSGAKFVGQFNSRVSTSYDFTTFVQRRSNVVDDVDTGVRYQIKIKPLNTLPANIDAEFFVEPYNNPSSELSARSSATNPIKVFSNNIDKSEFKLAVGEVDTGMGFIFGIPNFGGFLTKSQKDIGHMTHRPYVTNINYFPQYDERESDLETGYADTYVSVIRGEGNGLYDRVNGIVTNTTGNIWKLVPLSVNKEDVNYVFDDTGSFNINSSMDTKLLKNGRNLYKMRNFSIFSKGVSNDADFYTDYEGTGRIAKVEGNMANSNGLFEVVSTMDGNQKRINPVTEALNGETWRTVSNAYEYIKRRVYGKSYDIIDRFSIFEDPYYAIQAWWIPAQGNVTKGNERLLSLGFSDTANLNGSVGRKYLPHDTIGAATPVENVYSGDTDNSYNGIVSTTNGSASYNIQKVVAVQELIDEKFPLERWDGFEWADLDFIRKWKTTYTDDSVEYTYEIEGPRIHNPSNPANPNLGVIYTINNVPVPGSAEYNAIPESVRSPSPSIPRNLYSYWDNFDFEGRGTQILKCAEAYYYTSHDWKIYKRDIQKSVYDWTDEQKLAAVSKSTTKSFYDLSGNVLSEFAEIPTTENMESMIEDHNYARRNLVSCEVLEDLWYIPETNNVNIASINHNNSKYHVSYPYSNTGFPHDKNDLGLYEFNDFPRNVDSIVGEMLTNVYAPVADAVYELNVKQPYFSLANDDTVLHDGSLSLNVYRRGNVLQNSEQFMINQESNGFYKSQLNLGTVDVDQFVDNKWDNPFNFALSLTNPTPRIDYVSLYTTSKYDATVGFNVSGYNFFNYKSLFNRYDDNSNVESSRNGSYIYRKHNKYSDTRYGLNGHNNGIGGIFFIQNGYWPARVGSTSSRYTENTFFRGIASGSSCTFKDATGKYAFTDGDFVVEFRSYYAKADGDKKTNFGIKTTESGPNLNVVSITDSDPVYDKYCGESSYKYQYGRKQVVNINLVYTYDGGSKSNSKYYIDGETKVNNPYTKTYYKYFSSESTYSGTQFSPVNNGSRITLDNQTSASYITSRHRTPSGVKTTDVVDKSLINSDDPIRPDGLTFTYGKDDCISKNYNFWYFYNDGTRKPVTETYKNRYRWIYIDHSDLKFIVEATDSSGADFENYKIRCVECYQWADYSVMEFYTTHTIKELREEWGMSVVNSGITVGQNGTNYTLNYNVTLSGIAVNSLYYTGAIETTNIVSENAVEYSETTKVVGSANSANVITWATDGTSSSGNGTSNEDAGTVAKVTYVLNGLSASNTNDANYYDPYVTVFTVTASGKKVPDDVDIYLSESEDKLLSANYIYTKASDELSATLSIRSGVVNGNVKIVASAK